MIKKEYQPNKYLNYQLLIQKIKKLFRKENTQDFDANKLKRKLAVSNPKKQLEEIIQKLHKEEYITISNRGKYIFNGLQKEKIKHQKAEKTPQNLVYTGIVDKTKTGSAYIIIKELPYDVFIPNRYMMTAMDGDTVKIELLFSKMRSKNDGKIIEILKRAKTQFIGTYRIFKNYAIVFVESNNDELEIFIPSDYEEKIGDGEKVLVEITEWRGKTNPVPWGRVVTTLSSEDQNDIEMKSILINNGFTIDFPEEVNIESDNLAKEITTEEISKRRDFRDILTFTIDPATAKDFDDALSFKKMENGNLEIGVHIADVSHFVKEKTAIDIEAFKRSTSVYLVDRVAPMLPEELSNELCSLRPNEDSLTFSAVFEFDENHTVVNRWFGKTIIHSHRRFAYEEAQEIIDNGSGELFDELNTLNIIAKKLRKTRFKNGSIDFDTDEVSFILDEKGNPIDLFVKTRLDAHMLIEEYMLLANREVATFCINKLKSKKLPFVFRIHDLPDPDKMLDFANFTKELGFKFKLDTPNQVIKSFNELSRKSHTDENLSFLIPLALRTMAKAVYSTDNIGHFGLGFKNYTHFTSPIRRYSDVLVHRILFRVLNNDYFEKTNNLEEKCRHISEQERKAISAERESIKYKQVQYISNYIGETFEGVVSGFLEKGMFVELKHSKVEGMVEFKTLGQFYILNDERNKIVGKENGRVFKMGDEVKIKVRDADLERRRADFELVEE